MGGQANQMPMENLTLSEGHRHRRSRQGERLGVPLASAMKNMISPSRILAENNYTVPETSSTECPYPRRQHSSAPKIAAPYREYPAAQDYATPRDSIFERLDEAEHRYSYTAEYDAVYGESSAIHDHARPRESFIEKLDEVVDQYSYTAEHDTVYGESSAAHDHVRPKDSFVENLDQCLRDAKKTKQSMTSVGPGLFPWKHNDFGSHEVLSGRETLLLRSRQKAKKDSILKPSSGPCYLQDAKVRLKSAGDEARLLDDWNTLPDQFETLFISNHGTTRPTQGATQSGNGQGNRKSTSGCKSSSRASTSNWVQNPDLPGRSNRNKGNDDGDDGRDESSKPGVPGSRKTRQHNNKGFACFMLKFDPILFHKCNLQHKQIGHLWAHVKKCHVGTYVCFCCGTVFQCAPDLENHNQGGCDGLRRFGFITDAQLDQIKKDANNKKKETRKETKEMEKEEQEQLLAEKEWQHSYRKLFGVAHQGDPYLKESLNDEQIAHREYTLQNLEKISGTFLSDFYRMARALSTEIPRDVVGGQEQGQPAESSAEYGCINNRRLDTSHLDTAPMIYTPDSSSYEASQSQGIRWRPSTDNMGINDQTCQHNPLNHDMSSHQQPRQKVTSSMALMHGSPPFDTSSHESLHSHPIPRSENSFTGFPMSEPSLPIIPEDTQSGYCSGLGQTSTDPRQIFTSSSDSSFPTSSSSQQLGNTLIQPRNPGHGASDAGMKSETEVYDDDYFAHFYASSLAFPVPPPAEEGKQKAPCYENGEWRNEISDEDFGRVPLQDSLMDCDPPE